LSLYYTKIFSRRGIRVGDEISRLVWPSVDVAASSGKRRKLTRVNGGQRAAAAAAVTVTIPARNAVRVLPQALASLSVQTLDGVHSPHGHLGAGRVPAAPRRDQHGRRSR
jgi:hypothetical protein